MAQNISKKLSFVGENIKKIRQAKRISQAEFANLFNLARPSIGAYEEGRSEPKIDTLIQIAHHFNISIDVLLTRKLTVSEIYSIGLLNQKLNKAHRLEPEEKNIAVSSTNGIRLIKVSQYLDYIVSHKTSDFINSLTQIQLPVKETHLFRAFEMNGSEMEYHQQGLHHGDILLGKRAEISEHNDLVNKTLTIVHKDNLTTRRLDYMADDHLMMKSDDPNYPSITIKTENILEIWLIEAAYSKYLNPPSLIEERVLRLENIVKNLIK
ncbi:MAG: transcriptional regulator with XRE-family HTH domain [Cyclobacteriaceae bacterium]|jgi:transcriptional regulator with XRE-family HTH domain